MNISKLYIIGGIFVVTLLGWQVWGMAKKPLNERLYTAQLAQVDQEMKLGEWAKAQDALKSAASLGLHSDVIIQKQQQIESISSSAEIERSYMKQVGNLERVTLLDQVLNDYSNPKEMLDAAGYLLSRRELRLAQILIDQAAQTDPNYSGLDQINNYAKTIIN